MINCQVCNLGIENGSEFVAVANDQKLLVYAAHLACAPNDHRYDGAPSYSMNVVRAGVIASHILKANSK